MSKCLRCGAGNEWLSGSDNIPEDAVADAAFKRGAAVAAEIADSYNSSSAHKYRLGDCILSKLNIRKGRPRRNKDALPIGGMS